VRGIPSGQFAEGESCHFSVPAGEGVGVGRSVTENDTGDNFGSRKMTIPSDV
jgi:hypothetical protein